MLKDMSFLLRPTPDHKNLRKIRSLKNPSSQCPVSITMTIHVILTKIMRQKGCSIAIFVVHVSHRMARSMPTVPRTANKNEQKTTLFDLVSRIAFNLTFHLSAVFTGTCCLVYMFKEITECGMLGPETLLWFDLSWRSNWLI